MLLLIKPKALCLLETSIFQTDPSEWLTVFVSKKFVFNLIFHPQCLMIFIIFRLLDDFGHELEMTDSKLQQTVLKVEKVLRLSDGKQHSPTC